MSRIHFKITQAEEEKGTTEDETVGWHHRLYGHEFEQAHKHLKRSFPLGICM